MLATLLPHDWFGERSTWLLIVVAVVAIAALIKGADWLVDSAATAAYRLGLSKIIIGATIVSLGTTSPEAAVSVMAAWAGNPGLALGNGVGSIIVDTGLIFGLGCLFATLPADRFVLNRQGWVQVGAAALLAAVCYTVFIMHGDTAAVGRAVGMVFAILLVAYMVISVRWSRRHPYGEPHLMADTPTQTDAEVLNFEGDALPIDTSVPMWSLICWGVAGLAVVVLASDVLVGSATELAERASVPQVVLAATLVAFGTSLPEMAVGLTSLRKGHAELLVGNIIGADILNVLFVIGFAALAAPLPLVDEPGMAGRYIFLWLHLPTMLLMLGFMRLCIIWAGPTGYFSRWMGVPLVVGYVAYVVIQLVATAGS
ncbi:sodium:calcium antiporter [Phycisphaerales bacterium AB-hyl4]|uniref:Sodium:calcium antiporter n=1 Tax=Natronomicrosphaera hydrolytica TaxID=3242702 RepID=A0ABV4UA80_9BACT